MRSLFLITAILMINLSVFSQRSVDALFAKYSGDDDFVSVTINANLLKLAKAFDGCDHEDDFWSPNITRIRILAQENDDIYPGNFCSMVEREIDRKGYEEFMRIKKSDRDLVLLVRAEGKSYKELLLVRGGKDNLLIQINGNMTYKEAKRFADKMKEDCDVDIDIDWD